MDQRSNQLDEEGWIEDRSTTMPRVEESIVVETVEFRDAGVDSETERIKADIEDTRAEMGQTLNEIQERLSPEHIMDQVKETVREATIGKVERVMEQVGEKISNVTEPAMEAMGTVGEKLRDTGSSVTNVVRQNPIPFALMGLGLGMFIVNRVRNADTRTGRSRTYELDSEMGYGMATPRYAGMARQYESSSGEYAGTSRQYGASGRKTLSRVKETANEFAHDTAERVSHLGHQAKEGALRAGRGFQHLVQENPLAVGAAAVAVGAAVGLALPRTRIEHEYMGEASERLVDRAQDVARQAMDKVKNATQGEAGGQAKQGGQQGGQSQFGQGQQGQSQVGQGQHETQARTGPSQGGQSQSGHGQPGKTQHPGQPTPTA